MTTEEYQDMDDIEFILRNIIDVIRTTNDITYDREVKWFYDKYSRLRNKYLTMQMKEMI